MYAPPDGIGPAEALYVYSERVPREAFVASIMQTAEKGATTLDPRRRLDHHRHRQAGGLAAARPRLGVRRPVARCAWRLVHRRQDGLGGPHAEVVPGPLRGRDQELGPPERVAGARRPRRLRQPARARVRRAVGLPRGAQPLRHVRARADPGALRHPRGGDPAPGRLDPPYAGRSRAVVADRRVPPDPGHRLGRGPLRLLRPQGALHRLHPVGGRLRSRGPLGEEVPPRDRRGAAAAVLRRPLHGRVRRRLVRLLDGRRLLLDRRARRSRPTRRRSPPPAGEAAASPAGAGEAAVGVAPGEPVRHNPRAGTSR